MQSLDPATGRPLPADAIQRVLFVAAPVHVYNIPPLVSTKGYTAAAWTDDPRRHIFTARLRVVETAVPQGGRGGGGDGAAGGDDDDDDEREAVKTDVVLEDAAAGQLFAAAPYTDPGAVEPALDSSRFFALRVQDPAGRKAVLGIGFEERSAAFDFGVALQEARKSLGLDPAGAGGAPGGGAGSREDEERRDYSLKEGETITVNLGGARLGRRPPRPPQQDEPPPPGGLSSFSLPPPPPVASKRNSGASFLPPPPASPREAWPPQEGRRTSLEARRRTSHEGQSKTARELGFDDGQFGEFA